MGLPYGNHPKVALGHWGSSRFPFPGLLGRCHSEKGAQQDTCFDGGPARSFAQAGMWQSRSLRPSRATLSPVPPLLEELQSLQHQQRAGCAEQGSKLKRAFVGPVQRASGCSLRALLESALGCLLGTALMRQGSGRRSEGSADVRGRNGPVCQRWHSPATTNNSAAPKRAFSGPRASSAATNRKLFPSQRLK